MCFCSVMSRDWKINAKVALGLLSLFATVLTVSMPVEAVTELRGAVVRASDGHVYEIEYTQPLNIEDFYIEGLNGEVPSREVAAELYLAVVILNLSPIENPVDLGEYIDEVFTNTVKWKLIHEIAGIVGSAPYKVLLAKLTGGASAVDDIADVAALIGGISYDAAVLVKARMVGDTFAERSEHFMEHYNTHWLSVEGGTATSVDNIKRAYLSFWKEFEYRTLTVNVVTEHLFLPDWKVRVGTYLIGLVPVLDTVAFFGDAVLDEVQLNRLENLLESAEADTTRKAAEKVDAIFGNVRIADTVSLLERAGFFDRQPPVVENEITEKWLPLGGTPELIDITNTFSDPNGDPLTLAITEVTHTDVADVQKTFFIPDGESKARSMLEITPKRLGETWVTVEATDPNRLSVEHSFKVVVAPANTPPQLSRPLPPQTLTLGSASEPLDLTTYFHDLDSERIATYTATSNNTAIATVHPPTGSVITISASGIGQTTVTVTATDSDGLSSTQTFTVTVNPATVPQRPKPSGAIPDETLIEGGSFETVDVSAYFSDPEEDILTYTASTDTSSVVKLQLENSLLTITSKIAGTATVTVRATDPDGLHATQTFTVTITEAAPLNRAPQVSLQIPARALTVGNPVTPLPVSNYFDDPDGDALTYTASTSNATMVTVSTSGSLVRITPFTAGTATITVTASDGELQATQSFVVTITARSQPNLAPEVTNRIHPQSFRVGDEPEWRNLSAYFSDPNNNDTLTYTATSSNSRIATASIDQNSVKTMPVAPGTATITVTASDGELQATQSFRVTVHARLQTIPSLPVCDRTPQVRDEIMKRTGDSNCARVTEDELEAIRRLSLIDEGLVTLKQGDFDELRNLEELTLNENSLRTLPEDLFWYLGRLEELSLRGNQISILVEDTFEHLDNLTYLTLRGNQLTTLQQGAFEDLEMLTELDLSDNQLTTLPAGGFEELSSLEELTLENNRIAILSRGGFLGLSNLEDLDLDDNPLHTIKAGAFRGLSSLTDLDFYSYPLRTIEAGAFSGLNSLIDLNLSHTQLTTLRQGVFSGLSSLEDLYLSENPLRTIEVGAFSGLNSLTYLDLDETQLTTLRQGVFSGLSSLKDLDVYDNPLQTIEVGAFSGLSSLTDLNLSHTQLTTLRQGVFSGLSSLEDLDVYDNPLRTIEAGAFNGLSNLTSLDLGENQLAVLPIGVFSGLSRLRHLDLGRNQLNTLPADIFTTLPDLTSLNLRHNPGAPFTLALELARTDTTDLEAAGPATVKVQLAEGAPFDMNIRLSVEGGTLSADIATLTGGQTESNPITVTQAGESLATVRIETAPTVPQGYLGIEMAAGTPLVLFSEQLNRPPVAVGTILARTLAVGDAAIGVNVSDKFEDADEDSLHYTASSDNTGVVSVNMSGTQITLVPEEAGNATVTVTASDGQATATQTLSVSVVAAPTQNEAPVAVGVIPTQALMVDGAPSTVDISAYFSDANGDTLTYTAWPDDKAVVRLQRQGTLLTITPKAAGQATVTLRATDPDGLQASQRISVIVSTTEVPVPDEPDTEIDEPDTDIDEPDTEIETQFPDLIVESIRTGKTTVEPGAVFRVDAVIRNQGNAPSGDATVRFYQSADATITTEDTQVNRSNLPAIAVDRTKNKWARLTAPKTGGVYYYGVCIGNVADESDTENNCSTVSVKITVGTVPAQPPTVETPVTPEPETGEDPPQPPTVETPATPEPETGEDPPQAGPLAEQVLQKHGRILRRPDVKEVLPNVFTTLKQPDIQKLLTPATINAVIQNPDLLKTMVPAVSDRFITLMKTDADIQTLLSDAQVQTLLQTPAAIDELAKLIGISVAPPPTANAHWMPDANLRAAVRKSLGLKPNETLTPQAMRKLTSLNKGKDKIKDLTGLEHATNLVALNIGGNLITDITPLKNLTALEHLSLEFNQIRDITPLKNSTKLTTLFLYNNRHIRDITPLKNLTKLTWLELDRNQITDITPLKNLTKLTQLLLHTNQIRDVTPLENLTALKLLQLYRNPIADLAPLRRLKAKNPNVQIDIDINARAAPSAPRLPDETTLLSNYPNPFNPETWMPYQLATDTDVKITIYNTHGVVVRVLQLGHQSAGYYTGRGRAAYWDGRNTLGEQVASGVYFYQFETDDLSLMRKMVILK